MADRKDEAARRVVKERERARMMAEYAQQREKIESETTSYIGSHRFVTSTAESKTDQFDNNGSVGDRSSRQSHGLRIPTQQTLSSHSSATTLPSIANSRVLSKLTDGAVLEAKTTIIESQKGGLVMRTNASSAEARTEPNSCKLAGSKRTTLKSNGLAGSKKKSKSTSLRLSFDEDALELEGLKLESSRETLNGTQSENKNNESKPNDDTAALPLKITAARIRKDPTVDTSFLPDREREEQEEQQRHELRCAWLAQQEIVKNEKVRIEYSYWDGSGHRQVVECRKGDTIQQFLEQVRLQWSELRGVAAENLVFVKEDIIIPHHYTFYDFIVNQVRGKSGPIFEFQIKDDIRLQHDATKEIKESHPGKVCQRSWYERNKHIFPASRWEVFDPDKEYASDGYTFADRKK